MGLFPTSAAKRFLDTATTEDIYASSKVLLSGLFQAMQARTIYFRYGMHPTMRELMKQGLHHAGMRRFGGGGVLSSGDDEESTSGDERVATESIDVAVETCARRLAKLAEIPHISRGISFGIDTEPASPATTWHIFLHRGPLPQLDVELASAKSFHQFDGWRDNFIKTHCAHIAHSIGSGDNIALSLKRKTLFPNSTGNSGAEAVNAGRQLRRFCAEAWQKQTGNSDNLAKCLPGNGDVGAL